MTDARDTALAKPPSAFTAAVVVTYALLTTTCLVHWRLGGEYSGLLLLAGMAAAVVTALVPLTRPLPAVAWDGLLLAVGVLGAMLLLWDAAVFYVPYRTPGDTLLFHLHACLTLGLLLLCRGTGLTRAGRQTALAGAGLAVALGFGVTAYTIAHSEPVIDTLAFENEAARVLLQGRNPYAVDMPNVFGDKTTFYPPGLITPGPNSRVLCGYCYPPATLLPLVPAAVLHVDPRFVFLTAVLAAAGVLVWIDPSPVGCVLAVLLATCPFNLESVNAAWIEPLLLLPFALTVYAALRRPAWLPWAFGLFLAMKQYTVFYLPAMVFLVPRPLDWRVAGRMLGQALLTVAVLTLPMVAWDWHAYFNSTINNFLLHPALRADTLNVSAAVLGDWEHPLPGWVAYAAAALAYAACFRWLRPGATGFCLSAGVAGVLLFAFNQSALSNYYTLPAGMFLFAAAAEHAAGGPPYHRRGGSVAAAVAAS